MGNPEIWADVPESEDAALPLHPAPHNVDADPLGVGCIEVTWDRVHHADGYVVFRSDCAGGHYAPIAQVCCPHYTDGCLPPDSTWFYRVAARFGQHLGPKSAFAAATTRPGYCCHLHR